MAAPLEIRDNSPLGKIILRIQFKLPRGKSANTAVKRRNASSAAAPAFVSMAGSSGIAGIVTVLPSVNTAAKRHIARTAEALEFAHTAATSQTARIAGDPPSAHTTESSTGAKNVAESLSVSMAGKGLLAGRVEAPRSASTEK